MIKIVYMLTCLIVAIILIWVWESRGRKFLKLQVFVAEDCLSKATESCFLTKHWGLENWFRLFLNHRPELLRKLCLKWTFFLSLSSYLCAHLFIHTLSNSFLGIYSVSGLGPRSWKYSGKCSNGLIPNELIFQVVRQIIKQANVKKKKRNPWINKAKGTYWSSRTKQVSLWN